MPGAERGSTGESYDPVAVLRVRFADALAASFGEEYAEVDPVIRPSQFADVQANLALALAKRLHRPPREVAETLVGALAVEDLCDTVSVSGPGFVNIRFRAEWVGRAVDALLADPRLGVPLEPAQVVPVDYSAPNVAKEMHVGHLRTTVVGDALVRILEELGHTVVRQNHIGDWGTPFGMLIERLLDVGEDSPEAHLLESDPNVFYQAAKAQFDADPGFAERARSRVVALQAGDPATLRVWGELVELSKAYFNAIYAALRVSLTDTHLAGESSYNDDLAGICADLESAGIATWSEGALCVFLDGFTGREGKPVPLIIKKSDGGYGYGTTDLATIRHRVRDLHADRILYVVGAPQHLHLQMVFATARKAGWLPETVSVEHVQIGNVLGPDGKILRTRSGSPVRLADLLEEAVQRADRVLAEGRPELGPDDRAAIAGQVGIGAVKYADLSVSHDSEYTFDFDRMLALHGNTGPYLQYAAARIRSLFRRADRPVGAVVPVRLEAEAERDLGLGLLRYGAIVAEAGRTCEPHRLCAYLFDISQAFTRFYEECPVLRADPEVRDSRLSLSAATLAVIDHGLGLLGIATPERM